MDSPQGTAVFAFLDESVKGNLAAVPGKFSVASHSACFFLFLSLSVGVTGQVAFHVTVQGPAPLVLRLCPPFKLGAERALPRTAVEQTN